MSAWVVCPDTINHIVAAVEAAHRDEYHAARRVLGALEQGRLELDRRGELEYGPALGRELHELNAEAVRQRYPDCRHRPDSELPGSTEPYRYDDCPEWACLAWTVRALNCWLYQAGEGDVPDRELYKAVEGFRDWLCVRSVTSSKEYEEAPTWR